MKLPHLLSLALSIFVAITLTSCGLGKFGGKPEPTRFLKSTGTDVTTQSGRLPFQHAWRDPKVDISKYKNIVVRPVTSSFIQKENWKDSKSEFIPTKRRYTRRCEKLARYWSKSLNKAFSSPVCLFYKVSDTSQPNTLILETALTEVRFSQTPLAVCSFEARVIDASSGKLIATVSDRRRPSVKALAGPKKSISTLNEAICDDWSDELFKASNEELFPVVKRGPFSPF
ncbi:MAG: DUF3313 domain-containing protein [Akkermansiaceae bacterium]|nr:DUF3313 domain-containing protein [Akkermansiaceae bacterium]